VTAPGANNYLFPENIPDSIFEPGKFEILLLQMEIPLSTVEYAVIKANKNGLKIILNPAPVKDIPEELYKHLWLITPNRKETEVLAGVNVTNSSSAEKASDFFLERGVKNVIISMGADGAFVKSQDHTGIIPAAMVRVVDITAAGDVFNGALAVALAEGKDFRSSVIFANMAASISASRMGAQASAPYRKEISEPDVYARNANYAHFSYLGQSGLNA
jgi:ribokinase